MDNFWLKYDIDSKHLRNIIFFIQVFFLLLLPLFGCSQNQPLPAKKSIEEMLKDPEKSLWIVVNSIPEGASIYGYEGKSMGALIGKAPMTFRYYCDTKPLKKPSIEDFVGDHWTKTLVIKESSEWGFKNKFYLAFKCYIVMEGYKPKELEEIILDSDAWFNKDWIINFGGQKKTFTIYMEPISK